MTPRGRPFSERAEAAGPDCLGGDRPRADGKFLYVGAEKWWIRGVTYGTFRPDAAGGYGPPGRVDRDLARIAAAGFNAVRTYTVPPAGLLDAASRHGLRVMVGLPWEQHVAFLDEPARVRSIEERVRAGVAACAGHPAVLAYAIGNEIPAPIVRWHGPRRVERFLRRLYRAARGEDPTAPITYVNYPTTEYLDLDFVDLLTFNVYLEAPDRFAAYLARLQNLAGARPLIMAELGLDSRRHGELGQARALDWQLRAAFAAGCAGAFVFAWTDEWHRGGYDVEDWDFGLTRRDRRPKPALLAVRQALSELPFPKNGGWPRVSVVVCTYNGARTIRECLEALLRLDYPDVEVIVVDDGSTDATHAIAREYPFRLISTPNRGLSSARNTGWQAATGEIVAYIDDDAWPDPHWLRYLAHVFRTTGHAGVGGPNLPPADDGPIAWCVARAPGGPVHVLLSDHEAEHIPGCNMAFRRSALEAVGGFDPRFRTAGDDVDLCWRLQARGWTLGFHPAAVVWHRRRGSIRAYWRQQRGYGRAEALLERKWPEKYNAAGHLAWAGRLYGGGLARALGRGGRIYQGTWGSALFQSVYEPAPGLAASLVAMPEWYLVVLALAGLAALGTLWAPLSMVAPLAALAGAAPVIRAAAAGAAVRFADRGSARIAGWRLCALVALLHLLQPLARLTGRLGHGLTPWRRRRSAGLAWPRSWQAALWREDGEPVARTLQAVEEAIATAGLRSRRGGEFDRWDLEVRAGGAAAIRLLVAIEEHGRGRQVLRCRAWPLPSLAWLAGALLCAALAAGAACDGAAAAAAVLGIGGLAAASRMFLDAATALAGLRTAVRGLAALTPLTAVAPAGEAAEGAA